MLHLENLSCGYGPFRAVHSLTLEIEHGTVTALIGSNGSGKSSTLMTITGHVCLQKGRILFDNKVLNQVPMQKRIGLGISLVPEGRRLFPDLSTKENLKIKGYGRSNQNFQNNRDQILGLFQRLSDRLDQLAGSISEGEQHMVAIGLALMPEPRPLLIDELSLVLMLKNGGPKLPGDSVVERTGNHIADCRTKYSYMFWK